jgi:hypothetical protein
MRTNFWLAVTVVALCASCLISCSTPSDQEVGRPLRVEVSGTPAKTFTCSYNFRGLNGSVSNTAFPQAKTVLEGTVAGDGTVEIRKQDPAQNLTVDVYESAGHPIHLIVPPGSSRGKASRRGTSWHAEVF